MRGEIVYQVYGMHEGRKEDMFLDAFRTLQEAQTEIEKLNTKEMNGKNWAAQYHNKGFAIREQIVDTDFEIPSRPKPRDKYVVKTLPKATDREHGTQPLWRSIVGVPLPIFSYESAAMNETMGCCKHSNHSDREAKSML